MTVDVLPDISPLTPDDIASLKTPSEQGVAQIYLDKRNTVIYEPHMVSAMINGVNRSTLPDFLVIDPRGNEEYIEVTKSQPKVKKPQRRVMEANRLPYQVIGRGRLRQLGEEYSDIDFGI